MDYRFEEGGARVLLNAGLRLPPTVPPEQAPVQPVEPHTP
jgi:hypothetical protein